MSERFILDERSGIVAVIDTRHSKYDPEIPGCHADYPWVVASWSGSYVKPPNPECLNGVGHWTVEKRWITKAAETCRLLNELEGLR